MAFLKGVINMQFVLVITVSFLFKYSSVDADIKINF